MTFMVCWEFSIDESGRDAFQLLYGPEGAWVALFRHSPAYRGTELWHDVADPARYLTIDRWESRTAYEAFREEQRARYADLDGHAKRLTRSERCFGEFAAVNAVGESDER